MLTEYFEGLRIISSNALKFYKLHREIENLKKEKTNLLDTIEGLKQQLATSEKNCHALESRPSAPNAEFLGWYKDSSGPGLMPQISLFLNNIYENHPNASVTIALDFAAYGAITWNAHFNEQEAAIRSLSKRGDEKAIPVTIIVNSSESNKSVIESQYTDSVYRKDYGDLVKKLEIWANSDVYAALAARDQSIAYVDPDNYLDKLRNAIKNGKTVSKALFIASFLKFNERLIERYKDAGAVVVVRESLVPLHGWFYINQDKDKDTEGIIGIVDVKAVWNEPGFRVRGEVALKIKHLIDQFARKSNGN